jgi:hypothetical protein
MKHPNRHPHRWLAGTVVALAAIVVALSAGVSSAANYDTYYCGSPPTTYCLLGSGSYMTTASVALRDDNYVSCTTGCHTHVWYDNGSGAYDITHTNGMSSIDIGYGSTGYAYSRCETDSGYGSNYAQCHTTWHT